MPLLPVLLAADLPIGAEVPFVEVAPTALPATGFVGDPPGSVERFDPAARADRLAAELPRVWCGTYQSFPALLPRPATLRLATLTALGQMVDLRGALRVGETVTAVQGNLNAKSDQLDLVAMAPPTPADLEFGGQFQGLQGLQLSGWNAPRLTSPGGRLQLSPDCVAEAPPASETAAPVRGLW
jgi:hypothetical protein